MDEYTLPSSQVDENPGGPARKHLLRLAAITGLVAVVSTGSVAWLASKATTVKTELSAATSLLPQLEHELMSNEAGAVRTVEELKVHTGAAREAASDPLWSAAALLPWIGANFQAVNDAAVSADDVARLGAAPLVSAFQSLDWKTLTPTSAGTDLGQLKSADPKVASAAQAVRSSSERLNGIDTAPLIPQVSEPLVKARDRLVLLSNDLDAAASAARIAPAMLGSEQPRQYLLLVQNNAEGRATGGIPGALAVVTASNGKLTLGSQTSATEMGAFVPSVSVDPEQEQIYSNRLGQYMQDVNLTPDFPTAASTANSMWEKRNGGHLDGVISMDPVVLGYVLDATGPIQITSPELTALARGKLPSELSGKNVVSTLLSGVYAQIKDPKLQDAYFADVARETFGALSTGKASAGALLEGITRGTAEGRVRLWSSDPSEQSIISKYPVSGSVAGPSVSPAQFGVYFNDGTGAKMDYYVKRTVQLVEECTGDEYGQVKVRITSTNTAPADAATSLPAYVTGGGNFGVPAGTVQTNVIAYGPIQANVETASVDGKKVGFAAHRHANRPVGTVTVSLAPGQSSTVELTFGKIVQHTEPNVVVTPTVQAVKDVVLAAQPAACVPSK
ncbi:DUF4012 domain-containing protein [Arthrobacter sp. PAMC25564]|nr:DUF4012 domain-containing protein [Arthrobacter sp. PAMC25564]